MTDASPGEGPEIRRILVALDASIPSLAALQAAVHLAVELHAELVGLFVEDVDLLSVADLPASRQVGSYTAAVQALDRVTLETEMRALSATAERALSQAAEHARLHYSFRVHRGSVHKEVLRAAMDVDLVTLGYVGWSSGLRRGAGSTTQLVIDRGDVPVLVARRGLQLGAPAYVVYEDSEVARQGLALGARLASAMDGGIVVLVPGSRGDVSQHLSGETARLAHDAADRLGARGMEADYQAFASDDPQSLVAAARAGHAGVLVVPTAGVWLTKAALEEITRTVRCPVLVVRPRAEVIDESAASEA